MSVSGRIWTSITRGSSLATRRCLAGAQELVALCDLQNPHYGKEAEVAGKSCSSPQARQQAKPRGDLARGSIQPRQEAARRPRGLAGFVAQGKQIALLPQAPMRYPPRMDHDDTTSHPLPAGWLDAMDESDAQLAAGQTVPLEPLLDELRLAAAQLEAKLAGQPEHTAARHER